MKKTIVCFLTILMVLVIAPIHTAFADKGVQYYKMPIALWHAYEDKASMGDGAIDATANLAIIGDDITLYIGSKMMTTMDITTSLLDLYYDDGSGFLRAAGYAYDLEIDPLMAKRARVFSIPLKNKDTYIEVMVDPKVEPMGDDPIKARFKLDFDSAEEIDKAEAELIMLAESGTPKPQFNINAPIELIDKTIIFKADAGTFDLPFTYYANAIRGEELTSLRDSYGQAIPKLATVYAYTVEAVGPLEQIPYEIDTTIKAIRESYQPKKPFQLTIPLKDESKNYTLYAMEDKLIEIDYTVADGAATFSYDSFVPFALVASNQKSAEGSQAAVVSTADGDANIQATSAQIPNPVEQANHQDNALETFMQIDQPKNETAENLAVIVLSLLFIATVLGVSVFFIKKNIKIIINELSYMQLEAADKKASRGDKK